MLDKKIPFRHFSIKLVMRRQTPSDPPPMKQYRRNLIFKKVSFDRLQILKHCIRVRVRFLLDITYNIEYIMNSLCHYFKEELQESQSSQYTHFSKNDVLRRSYM